jgi:hypothetical protein
VRAKGNSGAPVDQLPDAAEVAVGQWKFGIHAGFVAMFAVNVPSVPVTQCANENREWRLSSSFSTSPRHE